MERLRPKPIDVNNITVTPQRLPDTQPSPGRVSDREELDRVEGESLVFTCCVLFMMIYVGLATPNTPYGAHWSNNPSPHSRKYYKKVVQGITSNRHQLSQEEIYKMERFRNQNHQDSESYKLKLKENQEMTDTMDKMSNPGAIPARQGRDKRLFDEIMEEKYQKQGRSWNNCGEVLSKKARLELDRSRRSEEGGQREPSQVLAGVVLLVAKKLNSRSSELHKIVESLGGEISWSLAPSVTHFVFQGKTNDLAKEFKQAKQQGCKIIAPDWVYMCRDENDKVSESLFPHTFNPRMKLNLTTDNTNTTINPMSASKLTRTNKPKPKAIPIPELTMEEQMIEEDLDDTVPDTVQATVPAEVPVGDEEEVKEISSELAGLTSLLGNINQTPVSSE